MNFKLLNKEFFKNSITSFTLVFFLTIISTYLVTEYIASTQKLFDTFINAQSYMNSMYILGLFASIRVAQILLKQLQTYVEAKLQIVLSSNIQSAFFSKLEPNTITQIETPQYQNDLNTIRYGISNYTQLLLSIIPVAQNLLLISIYFWILINQKWYLLILIVFYNLPNLVNEIKLSKIRMQYVENTSDISRQKEMYAELFTKSDAQKEILIFSMKSYLFEKWSEFTLSVNKLEMNHKRKEIIRSTIVSMVGPVGFMLVQGILLTDVFNKSLSIGQYMSLLTTIGMLEGAFISLIPSFGKLKNVKDMKNKFEYFHSKYLDESLNSEDLQAVSSIQSIETRNLFFKYPSNDAFTLRDINLKIDLGDIVVIVGDNGSGKSTLAKVILGLHKIHPEQIFFNNVDVCYIARRTLYKCMSMVTQDFIKYPFPLVENITLNPVMNSKLDKEFIAKYSYLFPKNIELMNNSLLGIDYEGSIQLSGGQWQRIAIARSLYKDASVLVLDEATSAMDPETESILLTDIIKSREKKITIIVTHRLNIARYATRVLVMHNGKIIEHGTHNELMNLKGKYFNMISVQSNFEEEMNNGNRPVPRVI